MATFKGQGGRKLCVGWSWIIKVRGGRLGAQGASVLLSPCDDGGDDTEQMCCKTPGKECLQGEGERR